MKPTFLALALLLGACGDSAGSAPAPAPTSAPTPTAPTAAADSAPIAIQVDASGYHPGSVEVQAGRPVTLVFTRTSDEGCGQQLVFPSLGIRKDLPLGEAVPVTFTPTSGTVDFTCGMNMLRGSVVVR